MRIAWIGLGRLGLPCALALSAYGGHEVYGYDQSPEPAKALDDRRWPHPETGLARLLAEHPNFHLRGSVRLAIEDAEIVFVAVQTPHAPGYDGSQPTPTEPRDFEYGYLVQAVRDLARAAEGRTEPLTVAVVSTVLPGTCQRLLAPLLRPPLRLAYTPSFIAMGTTVPDFLAPEFVLIGADDDAAYKDVARVWESFRLPHKNPPLLRTSVVSAETVKVTYNTFIGLKIAFANTVMEICHDTGADADEVTGALGQADRRLMSPAYLQGGMGDGGGCHPRDQLAMAWLAKRLNLSYDPFTAIMQARDAQTRWLADLAATWAAQTRLPIVILGKAYKPGTNITAGSPAALLAHVLEQAGYQPAARVDPYVDGPTAPVPRPAVYIVATRHEEFAGWDFAAGSVVIDPWRYMPDQDGVTVIRVGRR